MARLKKRTAILFVVVGLMIIGIDLWWIYHLRGGLTVRFTPISIVLLAAAALTFIGMRKSRVNTKGGDNAKAD